MKRVFIGQCSRNGEVIGNTNENSQVADLGRRVTIQIPCIVELKPRLLYQHSCSLF